MHKLNPPDIAATMSRMDRYNPQPVAKQKTLNAGSLRGALRHGQPGAWASDHREETDKFDGWHYIAIRAIAQQAAQAELYVFQDGDERQIRKSMRRFIRQRNGLRKAIQRKQVDEPLDSDHLLVRRMTRPNPDQSGASFRYEQVVQLCLTGTCLVWKVPNKFGKTVERYVIPTAAANPVLPNRDLPRGGYRIDPSAARRYVTDPQGFVETFGFYKALGQVIPAEQIMIIRWPHPLYKDDGMSPVAAGALWTDTANMVDSSRWGHLKRGPDGSVIVTPPDDWDGDENDLARAEARFNAKHGGNDNAGGAIFTTAKGVTMTTTPPKDMNYGEGWGQMRDALMAIHAVTPIAAGITDSGGSYAALYAALKGFVLLTVQPILDLLADEETEQQAPEFGKGLTVEYEAVQFDDPTLLEQQLTTDIAAGAITIDELRELRGREELPNGEGKKLAGGQAAAFNTPDERTTGVSGFPLGKSERNGKSNGKAPHTAWFDRVASRALNGRF